MAMVVVALAMALFVAGCGGSGDADQQAAPAPAAVVEAPRISPLEEALGFASAPGRRQYQLVEMQQQADVEIVQCMRQAGFFYAVGSAEERFRSGAFAGDESREFASTTGLGITSSFSNALAVDAAQAVPDAAATNLDYVASLTTEQASSYDAALVGAQDTADPTQAFEPAGCWGASFTEILTMLALIDEFEPELLAMNSRLDSDPRVLALQDDWSACMDASGYRFANEAALVDDVYARLLDIELVETDGTTQVASRQALDELAEYEQTVAVASFDCRAAFVDELHALRYDYEQEFLDDNRFRIAELRPAEPASDN